MKRTNLLTGIVSAMVGIVLGVVIGWITGDSDQSNKADPSSQTASEVIHEPRLLGGNSPRDWTTSFANARLTRDSATLGWLFETWILEEPEAAIAAFRSGKIRDKEFVDAMVDHWRREDFAQGIEALVDVGWLSREQREGAIVHIFHDQPLNILLAEKENLVGRLGAEQPEILKAFMKHWCAEDSAGAMRWAAEIKDPMVRRRGLVEALVFSQTPGDEEWMGHLTGLSSGDWEEPVKALIASLPPEDACEWLTQHGLESGGWESWAIAALHRTEDPASALALAEEFGWYDANDNLARDLAKWAAKDAPEVFVELFDATEDIEKRKTFIKEGITNLAAADPEAAIHLYQEDPEAFGSSVAYMVYGLNDPEAFLKILEANKEAHLEDYAVGGFAVASKISRTGDVEDARDLVTSLLGDPRIAEDLPGMTHAAAGAVYELVRRWPGEPAEIAAEAKEWADGFPEKYRDNLAANLTAELSTSIPIDALAFADSVSDPEGRNWSLKWFAAKNADWKRYAEEYGLAPEDITLMEEMPAHDIPLNIMPDLGVFVAQ